MHSDLQRGMKGIHQYCSKKHLHRYLAEFDFRYNERSVTDGERAETALRGQGPAAPLPGTKALERALTKIVPPKRARPGNKSKGGKKIA